MPPVRKPHLCFISESRATYALLTGEDYAKVGGAELQQTLVATALARRGHRVSFLVPDLGQPERVETDQGIELIRIRSKKPGLRGMKVLGDIARLFAAMKAADADAYYQRAGSPVTGIAALYCNLHHKPFVFGLASNMDLDGTWKRKLRRQHYYMYRYGLARATAIVAQTDDQMRLLRETLSREGVLIRSTYPERAGASGTCDRRYVLWVGNFWGVKRPAMYLELARRLPDYEFVMVGGPHAGEKQIYNEAAERAKEIPNLRFVGPVPFGEVDSYFDGAAVFVNTSEKEGFPNTFMQAWRSGIPTVATYDADHLVERFDLGRRCTDVDTLVSAVSEFMSDENLRAETGQRAIDYVLANHSPDAVGAKYEELFADVCRGREIRG